MKFSVSCNRRAVISFNHFERYYWHLWLFSRTSFHLATIPFSAGCLGGWYLPRSLCWSSPREKPSDVSMNSTMWSRTCWCPWSICRPPSHASTKTSMWDWIWIGMEHTLFGYKLEFFKMVCALLGLSSVAVSIPVATGKRDGSPERSTGGTFCGYWSLRGA